MYKIELSVCRSKYLAGLFHSCSLSLSSVGRQCCCLADGAQVLHHQPLLHALCVVPVTTVKGANAVSNLVLLLRDAPSKTYLELWTGEWQSASDLIHPWWRTSWIFPLLQVKLYSHYIYLLLPLFQIMSLWLFWYIHFVIHLNIIICLDT